MALSTVVRPPAKVIRAAVEYAGSTNEPAVKTGEPRVFKPIHVAPAQPALYRVHLKKQGWETFTGEFGGQRFINAVSVDMVNEVIADRIGAIIPCVDQDGHILGFHARKMAGRENSAVVATPMQTRAEQIEAQPPEERVDPALADAAAVDQSNAETAATHSRIYSPEALMKIADKSGINGLRAIAGPLGVKSRSIPDLIGEILKAQEAIIGADPSSILSP